MKTYFFTTTTTMKDIDRAKYWIDGDYIKPIRICAKSVNDALKQYTEYTSDKHCTTISSNALRNKQPMFVDRKDGTIQQVGYIITGKTMFERGDYTWVDKYIDLWVNIEQIEQINF